MFNKNEVIDPDIIKKHFKQQTGVHDLTAANNCHIELVKKIQIMLVDNILFLYAKATSCTYNLDNYIVYSISRVPILLLILMPDLIVAF